MAAVDTGARHVPPVPAADDLDDLFNYDVGDVFRDVDTNIEVPRQQKPAVGADGKENVVGLGIDEEIKVTKKRAPIPKLDENRLLGPAGIPKLRRVAKDRLKFKGKGHEYSDVSRLMSVYQLWLDELYPRAKFADGLAMIEKLGHSKRIQTMRREWINEGKPEEKAEDIEYTSEKQTTAQPVSQPGRGQIRTTDSAIRSQATSALDDEDDFYAATPKRNRSTKRKSFSEVDLFVSEDEDLGDRPPDDGLDALLAEDPTLLSASTTVLPPEAGILGRNDDFDDEMEAMAGMDDIW